MGQPMERHFLFGSSSSFKQAFSQLEEALIEYYETGEGVFEHRGASVPLTYTKPHQVQKPVKRCSNPRCQRGGYEIDREVFKMTLGHKTHEEFVMYCPGDEGTPKGRKKGDRCENMLHVRLTLKYKPTPE